MSVETVTIGKIRPGDVVRMRGTAVYGPTHAGPIPGAAYQWWRVESVKAERTWVRLNLEGDRHTGKGRAGKVERKVDVQTVQVDARTVRIVLRTEVPEGVAEEIIERFREAAAPLLRVPLTARRTMLNVRTLEWGVDGVGRQVAARKVI
jgi:hypothetical protein